MKRDIILRIVKLFKFVLREAKKPQLHTKFNGEVILLPEEGRDEKGLPKITIDGDLRFGLFHILLSLVTLSAFLRIIFKLIF